MDKDLGYLLRKIGPNRVGNKEQGILRIYSKKLGTYIEIPVKIRSLPSDIIYSNGTYSNEVKVIEIMISKENTNTLYATKAEVESVYNSKCPRWGNWNAWSRWSRWSRGPN